MNNRDVAVSLLDLICNSIVLRHLSPYLPVASRLALATASTTFKDVLQNSSELYRYTDLSRCKGSQVSSMLVDRGGVNWRCQRMDESLTEDDIYCGPLRGIFAHLRRLDALQNIHTLVLDGLAVPADLVQEIMSDTNVRILSIREAQHLNHRKLMAVLRYATRPTRAQGTPRLRGLYVFGPKASPDPRPTPKPSSHTASWIAPASVGVTTADGAQIGANWNHKSHESLHAYQDRWYQPAGRLVKRTQELAEWAETVRACAGKVCAQNCFHHDDTTFTRFTLWCMGETPILSENQNARY